MSSGERPIGAAKGKQSNTEALCQPPPPLRVPRNRLVQEPPPGCTALFLTLLPRLLMDVHKNQPLVPLH